MQNDYLHYLLANPNGLLTLVVAAVTAVLLPLIMGKIFPFLTESERREEDRRKKLHQNLSEKTKVGLQLTVQDVLDIGRGIGVPRSDCVEVIYALFAEAKEEKDISAIRHLIADLNKKAPYEDIPEEVKATMLRLSEICSTAEKESDKSLLAPIRQALSEYKTIRTDHQRMKLQNKVSYVIAIISFFIGIVGVALAFRGPSKEYIRDTVQTAIDTLKNTKMPNQGLDRTGAPQMAHPSGQP